MLAEEVLDWSTGILKAFEVKRYPNIKHEPLEVCFDTTWVEVGARLILALADIRLAWIEHKLWTTNY